ncbi:MAG: ribosomal protein S18-alanine N-acetyltransferase [Bacilli bacterium]|nr:ribosomal protein S18-alanine N-acetyltransferase [Bacilli bacterium]
MIRSFKIEDSAIIYELGNQIASNFSKTNDLEKIINDKYTKILVYEIDSEIVGFLMYIELENTIDIVDIIVKEAYRNKKIASCLLDNLITELKEKIKWITLEVRKSNTPAIKLYQKFDFSIINTRKNYYENEDAYLMGREIKNER